MKRVFLLVLDSLGIGAAADADAFGDIGSNTLAHIAVSPAFSSCTMQRLGLGNIDGVDCVAHTLSPQAAVGRFAECSMGKDTTIGHWEIAGIVSSQPFPTYPNGFPQDILSEVERITGRRTLCNQPYSGTQVIQDYGEQHIKTGDLIIYTSADSVFQIAAHESIVPIEQLYSYCHDIRDVLHGEHAVGRVIARPFTGEAPPYVRTANRRDFSLPPPRRTLLDAVSSSGMDVIAVGKISDIFAGCGVTKSMKTHSNIDGMTVTSSLLDEDFHGLCMINLVDFDMLYGHRQDIDGYAAAFSAFDKWLPTFIEKMRDDDVLFITADHGCDPSDDSTDHTREDVPLLVVGHGVNPVNLGTHTTFADIGATVAQALNVEFSCDGVGFWHELI